MAPSLSTCLVPVSLAPLLPSAASTHVAHAAVGVARGRADLELMLAEFEHVTVVDEHVGLGAGLLGDDGLHAGDELLELPARPTVRAQTWPRAEGRTDPVPVTWSAWQWVLMP
eukprot:178956-Hanusia_phi.AAC.1